jgi:hypothetical protein
VGCVIVDSVICFVVGAEYYLEFIFIVAGFTNLVVVCCDVRMPLVQVLGVISNE